MRFITGSFRLKTIIGIALIEAVLLAIIGWSSLTYLEESNTKHLDDYLETPTKHFSATTKNALL
jgi:hypothetical protein